MQAHSVRHRRHIPTHRHTALVLAGTLVWGYAQAENAAPVSAGLLGEVVVSASRAEQRSFDAPAAIQRIDQQQLQQGGAQVNVSEALVRVPGLTVLDRGNYAQDVQISMRGFGARSAFGVRGLRLLIDGIPATTPDGQGQASSISLTSMDRIEVLRGPAALMYGNSSGGVVQAFTRAASQEPEVLYQNYLGNYGVHRADYQFSQTVGRYGIVADYGTFSTDGYRANSAAERKQFNGTVSFDAGADTHAKLVFNQFDMPMAQDPLGLTMAQYLADPTQAGNGALRYASRKTVLQNQLGGSVQHDIDATQSLTARAYYGTRDNLQYQAASAVAGVYPATASWTGLSRAYYGTGLQYNARTQLAAVPLEWVAGYEYDRSREYRQGGTTLAGQKASTNRSEDNQSDNSDWFAQGTAMVSERFTVSGGVRASTVRFVSEDYFINSSNPDGSGSASYNAVIPMAGVTFHARDNLNLYANVGGGFETPTLAEMAYTGTAAITPVFNTSLNAASSQHLEMGLKWLPDPSTRVDLALYQITTHDEIVVNRSASGQSSYKNAPSTQRQGLELAASTSLSPHVSATLSASAIDAQYTESFASTLPTGVVAVAAGNKLPGIAQTAVFAELAWSAATGLPARKGAPPMGPRLALELVQSGRMYANDLNTASADGHTVFNLQASQRWALGRGSLSLYGRINNLGDERYISSVIVNQASSQFYESGLPRNYVLGLNVSVPL